MPIMDGEIIGRDHERHKDMEAFLDDVRVLADKHGVDVFINGMMNVLPFMFHQLGVSRHDFISHMVDYYEVFQYNMLCKEAKENKEKDERD